jgi:hypothetical protein
MQTQAKEFALDASLTTANLDDEAARPADHVRYDDLEVPREFVREVAGNLRSLAKVLPYAEYAAIVHRIAHLRWRCTCSAQASELSDRTESAYTEMG